MRIVRSVFLLVAIITAMDIGYLYLSGQRVSRIDAKIIAAQGATDRVADVLSTLKDAETGQRGFLLTGKETYLEPYTAAIARLGDDLHTIDSLATIDGLAGNDVSRLKQLATDKLHELDQTIQIRRDKGLSASLDVVNSDVGMQQMQDIRGIVARMLAEKASEESDLRWSADRLVAFRNGAFAAVGLFTLAFLWWAYRLVRENMAQREAASIAKDNFLATLSHELRTPLSPVLNMLNLWEASKTFPVSLIGDVQLMRRNVELEARLIDDLLDMTRIIKGKLPLNLETVDLHSVLDSVAEMYQSDIHGKGLRLSIQLNATQYHVCGDAARLQQIFWNIIKNAIKFTPESGLIEVSTINDAEGRISVSIHDTGIGMTAEALTRVFQPFEQASGKSFQQYGGLGLGLAISRAMTEAHGGEIAAESDGSGKGATFTVKLSCVDSAGAEALSSTSPTVDLSKSQSMHILLVEDHEDTALVMCRLLTEMGHQVTVANSIASALVAASGPFDILLSDIGLPDGTGIDLIRQLRRQYGDRFPAVALTGFGMEDDIDKCKAAGFDDHLTKPVNFRLLHKVISSAATRVRRQ
jgi:signal transduction histidine kinase/ActR/RegA family two-component response regulator